MGKWSSGSFLAPTEVIAKIYSGLDATITVGNEELAAIAYAGAAIASNIAAVTDIDDPANTGGWTDLVDITGGPVAVELYNRQGDATNTFAFITVDTLDAGAGKDLRLQLVIDGVVAGDIKIVSASGDTRVELRVLGNDSQYNGIPLYCNTSFKIRAARKGTFSDAGSSVNIYGGIRYMYMQRA